MTENELALTEVEAVEIVPAKATEITGLMEMALSPDVSVEKLERLVDLQERVMDRNARVAFIRSLHAFQKEVGPIPKTKGIPSKEVTPQGTVKMRSHYAPLPVIADHIRESLAKNGFSYFWNSSVEGDNVAVHCTLQHEDGHSQTATFSFREKDAAAPKMTGVQISGSARTYGERYSLIQVLGLTTADPDNDGNDDDGGVLAEAITDGQADYLKTLAKDADADMVKFLDWLSTGTDRTIASVEAMTQADFPRAVKALEEKKAKAGKEAGNG